MMKTSISIALIAIGCSATAADLGQRCSTFGNFAEHVMQARQEGKNLSVYLKSAQTDPMMQAAVLAAWSSPREATPEAAQRAVRGFHEQWSAKCRSQF
jgi:predicted lipoprotein